VASSARRGERLVDSGEGDLEYNIRLLLALERGGVPWEGWCFLGCYHADCGGRDATFVNDSVETIYAVVLL
jgi:hypothetical protein